MSGCVPTITTGGNSDLAGFASNADGGGAGSNFTIESCVVVNGQDQARLVMDALAEAIRLARSGVTYFDNAALLGHVPYEHWFGPWDQVVPVQFAPFHVDAFSEEPAVERRVRRITDSIANPKWQFIVTCRPMGFPNPTGGERCDQNTAAFV